MSQSERHIGDGDSVPQQIRRTIERRITSENLPPGHRLGVKIELQREFGVAGPTIDTALKLLANDGLISLRRGPGGGVFVERRQPVLRLGSKELYARDAETLGENIELREALGALLAVSAARAPGRDPALLTELEQLADRINEADTSFDTQQLIWRGHHILLELCDNSTLRILFGNLLEAAEALIIKVIFPETGVERARERRRVDAHADMFRAVVAGDTASAREFGEMVRIVSPLGRDGHLVAVGENPPAQLWAQSTVAS